MPTTEERNKETDMRLDDERYEAVNSLPRWDDYINGTNTNAILILGFQAVVKAVVYVGSCIRAQRIDG